VKLGEANFPAGGEPDPKRTLVTETENEQEMAAGDGDRRRMESRLHSPNRGICRSQMLLAVSTVPVAKSTIDNRQSPEKALAKLPKLGKMAKLRASLNARFGVANCVDNQSMCMFLRPPGMPYIS